MGFSPKEVKTLTLKDFNRALIGYNQSLDRYWDIARTIMSDIRSCAFGAKRAVKPTQVMKIPSIDNKAKEQVKHITSKKAALALLRKF